MRCFIQDEQGNHFPRIPVYLFSQAVVRFRFGLVFSSFNARYFRPSTAQEA